LIEALENRNETEAVVDASSQLILGFPEFGNGFGYKKRANYYTTLQMPDRALTDYEKALEIDPNDANSYLGRGYAYSWKREHQKALADYAKAIEIDPKFAGAYANRAILYADSLNQNNAALTDIDKALQLEPKEPEFYNIKSNILFKTGRKVEACACLKNGMALGLKSLEPEFKRKCDK
jgi:tetratricopeptide (TPR) repeat protein